MGALLYGSPAERFEIPDRALAHVKLAVVAKLRRGESFTMSLQGADDGDFGRQTIWIAPGIPLRFVFDDAVGPSINRRWLERLAVSANSTGGLMLMDEPSDKPAARGER